MHRARHDHASKVIANAKVLSCTKPQMTLRITIQVIDISVWKLPFITVGRPIGQDDMVAIPREILESVPLTSTEAGKSGKKMA